MKIKLHTPKIELEIEIDLLNIVKIITALSDIAQIISHLF